MKNNNNTVAARPKTGIKIQELDLVSYYGKADNKFHKAIRAISKGAGDISTPVHTGIVVRHNGVLGIAEMKAQGDGGLKINPIGDDARFIKGVTRFKFNNKEKTKIHKSIIDDFNRGDIGYAKKSAPVNFLFLNKNKKKLKSAICSEYAARKIDENSRYNVVKKWHRVLPSDIIKSDFIRTPNIRGSKMEFISKDRLFE